MSATPYSLEIKLYEPDLTILLYQKLDEAFFLGSLLSKTEKSILYYRSRYVDIKKNVTVLFL